MKNLPNVHRPSRCHIPHEYCVVNAHGDVVLCYNDYFGTHTFGNVGERSLLEIWRDPAFVQTREEISGGRFDGRICARCELDPGMGGRPRGRWISLLGKLAPGRQRG